jgi:hypothetical protein
MMTPNEYQRNAVSFRLPSYNLEATFAGLASEAGEVLGVRQKFLRDTNPDSYEDSVICFGTSLYWQTTMTFVCQQ